MERVWETQPAFSFVEIFMQRDFMPLFIFGYNLLLVVIKIVKMFISFKIYI